MLIKSTPTTEAGDEIKEGMQVKKRDEVPAGFLVILFLSKTSNDLKLN